MKMSEYMERLENARLTGRISAEEFETMMMNARILCDDDENSDERLPAAYAEIDYGDRIFCDPEAMDGARFDDMNFMRYVER